MPGFHQILLATLLLTMLAVVLRCRWVLKPVARHFGGRQGLFGAVSFLLDGREVRVDIRSFRGMPPRLVAEWEDDLAFDTWIRQGDRPVQDGRWHNWRLEGAGAVWTLSSPDQQWLTQLAGGLSPDRLAVLLPGPCSGIFVHDNPHIGRARRPSRRKVFIWEIWRHQGLERDPARLETLLRQVVAFRDELASRARQQMSSRGH